MSPRPGAGRASRGFARDPTDNHPAHAAAPSPRPAAGTPNRTELRNVCASRHRGWPPLLRELTRAGDDLERIAVEPAVLRVDDDARLGQVPAHPRLERLILGLTADLTSNLILDVGQRLHAAAEHPVHLEPADRLDRRRQTVALCSRERTLHVGWK